MLRVWCVILLTLAITGCEVMESFAPVGTTAPPARVHESVYSEGTTIWDFHVSIERTNPEWIAVNQDKIRENPIEVYAHPHRISASRIREMMIAINAQSAERVFRDSEIEVLPPYLTEALGKCGRHDHITFRGHRDRSQQEKSRSGFQTFERVLGSKTAQAPWSVSPPATWGCLYIEKEGETYYKSRELRSTGFLGVETTKTELYMGPVRDHSAYVWVLLWTAEKDGFEGDHVNNPLRFEFPLDVGIP